METIETIETKRTFTAFAGQRLIASGEIGPTIRETVEHIAGGEKEPILIFEDQSGSQVDFDLRGTPQEAVQRLASHPLFAGQKAAALPEDGTMPKSGPGRPSLGVVCREVSLLPRHWEWLGAQPGGASAAIRRLVQEARMQGGASLRAREARDAAAKFMWTMGGNLPGFEEASRALFAGDYFRLKSLVREWPRDIREHVLRLAGVAARLENEAGGGDEGKAE